METYERYLSLSRSNIAARFVHAFFFAVASAVCARIAFHLWYTPVPITLQVMGVILSGLVLGSRWGAISQLQYLFLGLCGFPVFAGGTSGPAAFIGPSGGYLIGFVLGAYLCGLVFERLSGKTSFAAWISGGIGIIGIYVIGASWLALWMGTAASKGFAGGLQGAWQLGIVPFIGIDMLKAVAASTIFRGCRSAFNEIEPMRHL